MALLDSQIAVSDPPPPPGAVIDPPVSQAAPATPPAPAVPSAAVPPPPPGATIDPPPIDTGDKTLLTGTPGSPSTAQSIYGGVSPPQVVPPPPPGAVIDQSVTNQPVTALDAAGGSLKAGVEGIKQIGPAVGLSAAQRQLDAMTKIDQGQTVDPNDDPLGYSAMTPEQRAKARSDLITSQATNIGTLAGSVQTQQNVPTDPGVQKFQQAKGWGETFSALGNAPIPVLQDAVIRGLPSLVPALAATAVGGPAAGIAVGTIGVGPTTFAGNLIQTMQQQGVDINDANARNAWVAKNGDTIKSLYDRAMNVAAATSVAQVVPFEGAARLPIANATGRVASGAGLGAATGAGAPVVESAITGEPVSPQEVISGGTTGAVFGAAGGAGGHPAEAGPEPRAPRPVSEQRPAPAAEAAPAELRALDVPPPPPGAVIDQPALSMGPAPIGPETIQTKNVEVPASGSSTPVTGAPAPAPAPTEETPAEGAPGERPAPAPAPAPIERPPSPPDVGAPDTGRVGPAPEPERAGGGQLETPREAPAAADTERAPGPALGAEPPKAPEAVAPDRSETGAPSADEGAARTDTGRPADDTGGRAEPVAEQPAPTDPTQAKAYYGEQARQINGGTMNDAAKAGKKPADGTLLWFLDGDKTTYHNAANAAPGLHRGDELTKFPSVEVHNQDGSSSRVWFKEGERGQADQVATALRMPSGPGRDRALGSALGYSPEDVERYVGAAKDTGAQREVPTSRQRAVEEATTSPGASPFREVFRDAGKDPDAAVQLPIANQARIVSEQTAKQFDFREIKSGQKNVDTVNQLSNFYQNGKAMASVLGVPYEALGMHGRLALDLQPASKMTGKNGYLGVYHPRTRTIGLPGRTNSFAHEWTHALDHYLAETTANNPKARKLLSETARLREGPHVAGTTEEAFAKVIGTLYGKHGNDALDTLNLQHRAVAGDKAAQFELLRRETDYARNAREFGDAHGGEDLAQYYYRPAEMLARAHEAYIADRIEKARQERLVPGQEAPFDTRAIAKPDHIYSAEGAHALTEGFAKLYPKLDDRLHIFEAFTQLHDQMTADHILGKGQGTRTDLPSGQDMMHPANWGKMANASGPKVGIMRQEINAWHNLGSQMSERMGMDPNRPKAPYSWATRNIFDPGNMAFSRIAANLETLVHRNPDAAKPYLQELADHVSPAERIRTAEAAKGRYIGSGYEEDVKSIQRKDQLAYEHAMGAHGLDRKLTPAEQRQFHQVMSGRIAADDPGVDPNIREAAAKVRHILNQTYYRGQRAGLDMGYTPEAYHPRMFEPLKIQADPTNFEKAAGESYGYVFDKNTDKGQNVKRLVEHAQGLRGDAHDTLRADARNLAKMDAERTAIEKRLGDGTSPDVAADQTRLAQVQQDADALHTRLIPEVTNAWSAQSAEDLKNHHLYGSPTDFDTRGPASSFTKGRVFTPEADDLLAPWMVTNPHDAIPTYLHQMARTTAFAEHFGIKDPKTGKLTGNLIDENIRRAGEAGMPKSDQDMFRNYIEAITGSTKSNLPNSMERMGNTLHAVGTMALMPRSAFTSLGEPMAMQARTGSVRSTLGTLANQIGSIFQTAGSKERREYAEAVGAISSHYGESLMSGRVGQFYANDPRWNHVMTNFYRRIGLTQLTNAQTHSGMDGARYFMQKLAKDYLNPSTSRLAERNRYEAQAQMRDLGIADADHKTFSDYAQGLGASKRPKVADLQTEGGAIYGRAVTRLIHQTIQDPLRANKPLLATQPGYRFAYGLQAFNYSFFHNIVQRTFESYWDRVRDAEGIGKLGEIARAGGHFAAASGAIYAGSMLSTIVREALMNPTQWKTQNDQGQLWSWLNDLAIQRTGVNGPLDPLAQAVTGLKYEKSLTGLFAGAQLGYMTNAAEKILRGFVQRSPNTNTSDYNALQGFYNLVLVPAETLALTALPGGPLTGAVLGGTMMTTTSPGASDWFARQFVGKKGTEEVPKDRYGRPIPKLPSFQQPKAPTPEASGGPPSSAGLGFADDVAVPLLRGMMRLPGVLKYPAMVAAAVPVVSMLAHEFGRFTQPDTRGVPQRTLVPQRTFNQRGQP